MTLTTAQPDGLELALLLTVGLALLYIVGGMIHDLARRRAARISERARTNLAIVLFKGDAEAGSAAEALAKAPQRMLLDMIQRLAVDLDGEVDDRLRKLVSAAGFRRPIRQRLTSRSWRRRAQGAALASLLPQTDPLRTALLHDSNATVRARIAESLDRRDVVANTHVLIDLLGDEVDAVKFAAQQALLRADARIVPDLARYLCANDGAGVDWALDVAANIPDPRLVPGLRIHTRSEIPARRALAIAAIAPWLDDHVILIDGFADEDALVRATAAEAAGVIGAQLLAAHVGRLLGDQAWTVRRQAGLALATMGPAGLMALRVHLDDPDPYAQDMARQVLDTVNAGQQPGSRAA